ncbi:MAG: carboxypeptidase-like regulatory domain-containing protein [Vicinamibacterales bacterium]
MALPRLLVVAVLAAWIAPAIAWAQPGGAFRQPPPRMLRPGEEPPKGTAVLRGVVVAADSGAPVRRAQVRASASDTGDTRTTLTDEHGRFELRELAGGHYALGASKGGFISLQYGQRRPGEAGTPVDLAAGQTLEKLTIALPRGSVITGRIVDEYGEPLTGAQVQALRNGWVSGARRLQAVGAGDRTDDQGTYRIFGLPPGEYLVTATLRDDRPMLRGGQSPDDVPDSGYAPTYFPGTSSLNDAQKVNVGLGEEVSGVGFGLSLTRLASISGRVLAAAGYESGVQIVAVPADGARLAQTLRGTQTRNDGTFDLRGVPPGRYRLQAMSWGAASGEGGLTGATTITVNGANLEGLTVALAPAPTISGLVQSDTNQGGGFRASQVRITAVPVTPSAIPMGRGGRGASGRANDDFTFQTAGLSEPAYLRVNAPGGWYVKGIYADGRDITETPLALESGSRLEGVRVVLTQTASSLSGAVRDAKGNAVLDASVVIFPDDESRWTPQSRFIATARPDTTGTFTIGGLPASQSYRVVAVQGLESGQANDPEFLASVRDQAERLTLGEGEAKTIELRLKP